MGLPRDFLALLRARVVWKHASGKDAWGNETYAPPRTIQANLGSVSESFGTGENGERQEGTRVRTRDVMTDAVGVSVGDVLVIDSADWWVTDVSTESDEDGSDLYQDITVEDQKKG